MSSKVPGPQKDAKMPLQLFLTIQNELIGLHDQLKSQEINSEFIEVRLRQIMSLYEKAFEQSFKPQAEHNSSPFISSYRKIDLFTFTFLSSLSTSFQEKLHQALAEYHQNPVEKKALLIELGNLEKLINIVSHLYVGKLINGAGFLHDFNRMLLTINDNSLLTTLITDYGLGSRESNISQYTSHQDLDIAVTKSIHTLDEALQKCSPDKILQSSSPSFKV